MVKTDDPHAQILFQFPRMGNYYQHIDEVYKFSQYWSEVSKVSKGFESSSVLDSENFADAGEDHFSSDTNDIRGPISESDESFEIIDQ